MSVSRLVFWEMFRWLPFIIALPFVLAWPAAPALGQSGTVSVPTASASLRRGPIHIDDEPDWRTATPITAFVQGEPVEGVPPQERTDVRVLYDAGAPYVAAVMHESDPRRIGRQLVRRDDRGQYDHFEVSIDPDRDGRTGYRFRVGASGVQRDVYLYDDVREDQAWDAVWESAVSIDSTGWSVEMRIPLSQIRYVASDAPQVWDVNFARHRVADDETAYFALQRTAHRHVANGHLRRLSNPTLRIGYRSQPS